MDTVELLKKLTSAVGVSGAEEEIQKTIIDIVSPMGDVTTDSMNNVYCTFGEGTHFLLDAHMDEIGMIVKGISDDGFVKVDKCGGIDRRMLAASEVVVLGDERVPGVISTLPPHLQKGDNAKKVPELDDISIDIGMSKTDAEKIIHSGDRIIFKRNFKQLAGNMITSSVLDDRSGVCAVILAAEKLKNANAKITLMFSTQEEVGTRGAKIGTWSKDIDEAISVDVSFGYTPFCKRSDCGEIGNGPMVGFSSILSHIMSKELCDVAKTNKIPYQREVMGGGHTGTNADVITTAYGGVKTGLVSIPEKYMHSPVEVVDVSDVENTADLIAKYILSKVGEKDA